MLLLGSEPLGSIGLSYLAHISPAKAPVSDAVNSNETIEDIDISVEMQSSFLEYAYSVIYSRALPDARDGLKPVQRRILYQMTEMGLRPERGHVKSARVVGEVMGKLHPHGDASIYDALVRLAQDFTMSVPLIDGHGNFGSLDDGPAAARYTEVRLTGAALAMTADLDEDVVDFVPNYDSQLLQPDVLPAAIPNLLVNGASGIAVGMATNLAPHNLVEVVNGALHLLHHPDASVEELMAFIPGPDLPGGGVIHGLDGIREAYETGRGAFRTRAKVSIEQLSARKSGLVVTELPFLVGPERVIEKVKQGIDSKKLSGISDIVDLTDRKHGLRMVISIKNGFDPAAVLEQLFRVTPLEDSFSINNVALVDGQPQTLNLKQLLEVFIGHRIQVVTRRSSHRLMKRQQRLHLVDGLLIAILDIDEVIELIRSSDDADAARTRLREVFDLSHEQAEYILELRLRRLTKFSRVELEQERDELRAEIADLEAILEDPARLRSVVAEELDRVAAAYGTPRRTVLTAQEIPVQRQPAGKPVQLEVADEPCLVMLSTTGLALRTELPDGEAERVTLAAQHGALRALIRTSTRSELLAVLDSGIAVRFTPADLPKVPSTSASFAVGVPVSGYLSLEGGSTRVVSIVSLSETNPLALFTRSGMIKRVSLADLPARPECELISLKDADAVVACAPAADSSELVFLTSDAQLLRFQASLVRVQGRQASGMAGIRLNEGCQVIAGAALEAAAAAESKVVTIARNSQNLPGTESCTAKVSMLDEFPAKGRATGGVRAQRFLKGEDELAAAWVGEHTPVALTADGKVCALPTEMGKRDASGAPVDGFPSTIGYRFD